MIAVWQMPPWAIITRRLLNRSWTAAGASDVVRQLDDLRRWKGIPSIAG